MADEIRTMFRQFSRERSQLIARTESANALNQSTVAAYTQAGVQVVDVLGCEDSVIMPGQIYGCNSRGVPIEAAADIEFHPNHKGVIVARPGRGGPS